MSVRTMARVWADSRQSGTHLLMLLAIADFSDDDGVAYPAVGILATKCRMQTRNAQVIIAALRKAGELEVRENEGPKGTNLYQICFPRGVQDLAGVQSLTGVQGNAPGGAKDCAKGVQRIAPEPSLNHQRTIKRARNAGIALAEWIDKSRAGSPKKIEDLQTVMKYATSIGLDEDFVQIAWRWFKAKYVESPKRYVSWEQTFLNAVRNNWGRLWYQADDGTWKLTTAGKQVAVEHDLNPAMRSGKSANPWYGAI